MKIVVTGASGFLGSWVCRILSHHHEVTAIVREESDTFRLSGIEPINVIHADPSDWAQEINRATPDVYVSMDWWGVGGQDRNEIGQHLNVSRIRDLLRQIGPVSLIVGVGSQAELGPVSGKISECLPDNPTTLYGQAKVQVRALFEAEVKARGSRLVWARVFSSYGPLDSETWLIPSTILTIARGERMPMTEGEQVWSFLHALDVADAFRAIIESEDMSGVVNVGHPETVKIRELTNQIGELVGRRDLLDFGALEYRPDQVFSLEPDCKKLIANGWYPKVSIQSGLDHLHSWLVMGINKPIALRDGTEVWHPLPLSSGRN
jgi:nucleoside-diphosphate-sugar epimerase